MHKNYNLKSNLVKILKHGVIYGAGWLIASIIRLALMPVFTRYLDTFEYGTVALLDSAVDLVRIVFAAGIGSAIVRFFHQQEDQKRKDAVVSTGIVFLLFTSGIAGIFLLFGAKNLSAILLGSAERSNYVLLALGAMVVSLPRLGVESMLAATNNSRFYSAITVVQSIFCAALNLYLVIVLDLGVLGILIGNFFVSFLISVVLVFWSLNKVGWRFHKALFREMLRFGLPMVPALLAATAMHQSDRLFIRAFSSLEDVGLYSIAYQFPFMLNAIFIGSFERIWGGSVIYDIAKAPDSGFQFRRMCTYTMIVLGIALFGTAIAAKSIVEVFTGPAYRGAAQYIPAIAFGVWVYSLHTFVRVGVVLTKKSHLFPINYGLACAVNIGLNFILVPIYGPMGAAWSTVITYICFSIGGFFLYRSCYPLEFEWGRLGVFAVFCILSVIGRGEIIINGFLANLFIDFLFFLTVPSILFVLPGYLTPGEKMKAKSLTLKAVRGFF